MKYPTLVAAAIAVVLAAPIGAQEIRASAPRADLQPAITLSSTIPQTAAPQPATGAVVTAERAGPTMAASVAGVRTQSQSAEALAPVAVERVGRNPALMIVGAAALVVGAIIGDDAGTIVMVGGAVVGLIGLWNFLR